MSYFAVAWWQTMTNCSTRVLLGILDERGAVETTTLATVVDAHPMTVATKCHELQTAGHVRQVSGGVYSITDAGEQHLATLSEH